MRRLAHIVCIAGQLAFTGPALAQSFSIGLSEGPFSLSLGTGTRNARTCEIRTVPTGGTVRLRNGMIVESVSCADADCTRHRVVICPRRR